MLNVLSIFLAKVGSLVAVTVADNGCWFFFGDEPHMPKNLIK